MKKNLRRLLAMTLVAFTLVGPIRYRPAEERPPTVPMGHVVDF